INDILDLERLESGKMEMRFETVEVATILDRSIEAVKAFAVEQQIELVMKQSSSKIYADGERLVQVLVNLLSNAVKFSPKGSEVSISAQEAMGWVEVRVMDRGRGIPSAYKAAIFE